MKEERQRDMLDVNATKREDAAIAKARHDKVCVREREEHWRRERLGRREREREREREGESERGAQAARGCGSQHASIAHTSHIPHASSASCMPPPFSPPALLSLYSPSTLSRRALLTSRSVLCTLRSVRALFCACSALCRSARRLKTTSSRRRSTASATGVRHARQTLARGPGKKRWRLLMTTATELGWATEYAPSEAGACGGVPLWPRG